VRSWRKEIAERDIGLIGNEQRAAQPRAAAARRSAARSAFRPSVADGEVLYGNGDGGERAAAVEVRHEQAAVSVRAVEGVTGAVDGDVLLHHGKVGAEGDVGAEDDGVAVACAARAVARERGAQLGFGRHRNRRRRRQRRKQRGRQHGRA
jgi:hypothetical protein